MTIREWLYLNILSGLKFLTGYFEGKLGEYYTRKSHEYADAFLKKFREGKDGTWQLGKPETWPRKSKPNSNCDHRKGGQFKIKSGYRDYNVAGHSFPDGTVKIWCLNNCGFTSRPGDVNWRAAIEMLESSSNKMSASERILKGKAANEVVVTYQDSVPDGRA